VRQRQPTTGAGEFEIRYARGFLDREKFLALLNGRLGALGHATDWAGRLFLEMEDSKAGPQLRRHIDEWIDTGVEKDGVEDPRTRNLTGAPNARSAIRRFNRARPVELTVTADGLSVSFLQTSQLPTNAGGLMQRVGLPEQTAQDAADRFLALFFLSPEHEKLAKCRRVECGRYFELRRWNQIYKRGTFCPECTRARSLESAALHTSHARKVAERELYRLVAKRFSTRIAEDPKWQEKQSLKAAIIQYLLGRIESNEALKAVYRRGGRQGIGLKWLGWAKHQRGIESAVKESTHAQSKRT